MPDRGGKTVRLLTGLYDYSALYGGETYEASHVREDMDPRYID
jgi:hypothetical protein